jgi:toxin ParE1/3/4
LDAIAAYLTDQGGPLLGYRFIDAVKRSFATIALFPAAGSRVPALVRRLRGTRVRPVRGFESYLIFYRFKSGHVDVLRVIHGARRSAASRR